MKAYAPNISKGRTVGGHDTHRLTLFRYWGDIDDYACGISMNPSGTAEDVREGKQ